jgi:hypothetical protein
VQRSKTPGVQKNNMADHAHTPPTGPNAEQRLGKVEIGQSAGDLGVEIETEVNTHQLLSTVSSLLEERVRSLLSLSI